MNTELLTIFKNDIAIALFRAVVPRKSNTDREITRNISVKVDGLC